MNSKTILYIEDNPENRLLIRRILEAEGYSFQEAANARDAIQWLKTEVPDLILMDINMPDIDGYTLTSIIKQDSALVHIPIVAVTANVMKGDREKTIDAGCDGYIQKPIDVDNLPYQILRFIRSN